MDSVKNLTINQNVTKFDYLPFLKIQGKNVLKLKTINA